MTCSRHDGPRSLRNFLRRLCLERSRGKPLQYVIGDQPFGDLEILCKPGVLIPRPETETWTTHLANCIISRSPPLTETKDTPLRILDLCTGTGCISLLLHSLLHRSHPSLEIHGIDLSPKALKLANQNLHHNISKGLLSPSANSQIHFIQGDIFVDKIVTWQFSSDGGGWDILVANPPYISPEAYNTTTTRSVRKWEPKAALVPRPPYTPSPLLPNSKRFPRIDYTDEDVGDRFFPRILQMASETGVKVLAMEVGDMAQAERIVRLMLRGEGCFGWERCEIWCDELDGLGGLMRVEVFEGKEVVVRGKGHGRVVVGWR